MREQLDELAGGMQFYVARNDVYASNLLLPFRLSSTPFAVDQHLAIQMKEIGYAVTSFMNATSTLYREDETVRNLLDRGKPDVFKNDELMRYLFWRPDLILTESGPVICEIETSPFGLGLSVLLDRGYRGEGFNLLASDGALELHIAAQTPSEGLLVRTDKAKAYEGQLQFLAEKVFSGAGRSWVSTHISEISNTNSATYRAHYLSEIMTDPLVAEYYNNLTSSSVVAPSSTPQFEEKALMAFLWDRRFEGHYRRDLGAATVNFLRKVIPPTWILGEEDNFLPGLPYGIARSEDLANLTKSNRQFVLKCSGFADDASWSQGVTFLARESRESASKAIGNALAQSSGTLSIVQEFKKPADRRVAYIDEKNGAQIYMMARTRVTPYFSTTTGELLSAKATHCEATTHRIHAGLTSINTAVGIE